MSPINTHLRPSYRQFIAVEGGKRVLITALSLLILKTAAECVGPEELRLGLKGSSPASHMLIGGLFPLASTTVILCFDNWQVKKHLQPKSWRHFLFHEAPKETSKTSLVLILTTALAYFVVMVIFRPTERTPPIRPDEAFMIGALLGGCCSIPAYAAVSLAMLFVKSD